MQLKTSVRHLVSHVRDPVFGHRRLDDNLPPLHVIHNQLVHKGPPDLDLRGAFHQRELIDLKLGDGFSKNRPFPTILDGGLQHVFGGRDSGDGDDQTLLLKLHHEFQESGSFFAQTVLFGNSAVREIQLGGILAVPAGFFDLFALLKAGRAGFHNKKIHRFVGVRTGRIFCRHNAQITVDPVADKGFLPVQDNVIPVLHGGRLDRGKVAAGIGLRHGHRRDNVAGDAAGKILLLLVFRTEGNNVRNNDIGVQGRRKSRKIGMRQFLGNNHRIQKIRSRAAVFHRNGHAQKPVLPHFLPGALGNDAGLFPFLDMGKQFIGDKLPESIPEHSVFIRILNNIHSFVSSSKCIVRTLPTSVQKPIRSEEAAEVEKAAPPPPRRERHPRPTELLSILTYNGNRAHVLVRETAQVVCQTVSRIFELTLVRPPLKLQVHFINHPQSRGADGMSEALETSVDLGRDFAVPVVHAV